MHSREALERSGKPGSGNTLAARRQPRLQGCDEGFNFAVEIGTTGIQQILLPRRPEPILVPADVKRIGTHRDGMDEVVRSFSTVGARQRKPMQKKRLPGSRVLSRETAFLELEPAIR